jgi:glutathione S-transferase
MKLTLYHSVESTCAQKVRIVAAAKNLQWEEIRLNLRKGEQFSPRYLQLNPKAVVPTLVHDGVAIRESSVINEYLEDCFPEPSMVPDDPIDRARMRLLVKTIDEEVHPAIGVLSYAIFLRHQMNERMSADELRDHFGKVADPARRSRQMSTHEAGLQAPVASASISALKLFAEQLSSALDNRSWLVGNEFSLADAAALPYMVRARALLLSSLWDRHEGVAQWLDRGIEEVSRLPLTDIFGSQPFHDMVSGYASKDEQAISKLLEDSMRESPI